MSRINGTAVATVNGFHKKQHKAPETGPQAWDEIKHDPTTPVRARLHDGQSKRFEPESPLVKFARVWP